LAGQTVGFFSELFGLLNQRVGCLGKLRCADTEFGDGRVVDEGQRFVVLLKKFIVRLLHLQRQLTPDCHFVHESFLGLLTTPSPRLQRFKF
jgi:hypothetical protein